jgi:uncharacterized protein YjbJ (UPF0337 family)
MLNDEQIKGKWNEIRGGIRNLWGKVTDDELNRLKGNFEEISGIIEQRYGETKSTIKEKLDRLLDSFDNVSDRDNLRDQSSFERRPDYDSSEIYDADQKSSGNTYQAKNSDLDSFDADRNARH